MNSNGNSNSRSRRHWKWIITVIVAILIIWSFKWIWPGHHYDKGGHRWMELSQAEMNERMEHGAAWAFKKFDTTDEQEEVILAEFKSLTPFILKLQGEKLELTNKFRAVLEQENADTEALNELVQEVKGITDRSLDKGFDAFLTIWETLTPEQRDEILEHWER